MSAPTLIDDSNPAVQYKPGWKWEQPAPDVDDTRHGAATANLTAWLDFTGTGIQVVGTLESSDTSGRPTTSYSIDGVLISNYTAPFTPAGTTVHNVTFFSKRDLSADKHQILITNLNGTSPNIFWLDFFLVDTVNQGESTSSVKPFASIVSTALSSSVSTTASGAATLGTTPSSVASTSSGTHHRNIGAIVGGVVGGVVAAAVICTLLTLFMCRRRSSKEREQQHAVEPYVPEMRRSSLDPGVLSDELPKSPASSSGVVRSTQSFVQYTQTAPTLSYNQSPAASQSSSARHELPTAPSLSSSTPYPTTTTPTSPSVPFTPSSQALSPPPSTSVLLSTTDSSYAPSSPGPVVVPKEVGAALAYAPPELQSRVASLFRGLFSRGERNAFEGAPIEELDSGLRLYNEGSLPPRYTEA